MKTPLYLFRTRRFAPLFGTQFLGAFNDNLFKNTLAVILTFDAAEWTGISAGMLAPIIGAVFILPFFLFSGLAGDIADRYDKAQLARIVKIWEIVMMAFAFAGYALHSFETLLAVIFGMGMHSTLFGPIKYSIIPQHMHANELIGANAFVESGTFAAILLGTIAGGALAGVDNGGLIAAASGVVVAAMGYGFSRAIPSAPAHYREEKLSFNLWKQTRHAVALSYKNRNVFVAVLAISWFWLYGALLLSQFPSLVKGVFYGNETTVTLILALFTLGIGVGSTVCERLSRHRIRISLVVSGGIGMTLAGIDFASGIATFVPSGLLNANPHFWHIVADITLLGIFGGLYSVPLYALVQEQSDEATRSRIIAANNILNALFMVIGAIAAMIVLSFGMNIAWLFFAVAVLTAGISFIIRRTIRLESL